MAELAGVIDLQAWRAARRAPALEATQPEPDPRSQSNAVALGPLSATSFALPMAFFAFWPAFVAVETPVWPRHDVTPGE
ncbi:hypothetical protein [Bradyrhizobium sp. 2TAF24]|uniref:hypothetical protein n=1 Tax=Bradyrhizobium sp. 2TAF24 TaxID=3233011 RepID=UPI003F8F6701